MKVARVLSDREVAISGGAEGGVGLDDVLLILEAPQQIIDPDTKEVLGEIARTKAVVKVYDVQDKFVLARTFRKKTVNVGGRGIGAASVFGQLVDPPKFETRRETLRRGEDDEPLDPMDSAVFVGDSVELFNGDPDDVPTTTLWR